MQYLLRIGVSSPTLDVQVGNYWPFEQMHGIIEPRSLAERQPGARTTSRLRLSKSRSQSHL